MTNNKQERIKASNVGDIKFALFIVICILAFTIIDYSNEFAKLNAQLEAQRVEMLKLQMSNKVLIEATAENFAVDSLMLTWQARYWSVRDKALLEKMAEFASIKKRNLQQALQFMPDSTIFKAQPVVLEVPATKPDKQVSFSANK